MSEGGSPGGRRAATEPPTPDWVEEVVAFDGVDFVVCRPHDADALIDEDAFQRDEQLPYWAELWPSGVALARALHGRALGGRRVLELGCGLALPSIVAATAGARVLATDWSDDALDAALDNATRNGVDASDAEPRVSGPATPTRAGIRTLKADWRDPEPLVEAGPFDLVLAADVLYEARNVEPLLELLRRLDAPRVLVADPGRATADPFLAATGARTVREDGSVRVYEIA